MSQTYQVFIGDVLAGYLQRDTRERIAFRFAEPYLLMANRPVLGQRFEDDLSATYWGKGRALPPFFANLIPEKGGALRGFLERSFHLPAKDDLALLIAVGADLPGALRVLPSETLGFETAEDEELDERAAEAADQPGLAGLRFSLGGVQMKFSMLLQADRVTLPGPGRLGDWIVKLDSTSSLPQLVENEYATMEWARAANFEVPVCRLLAAEALPPELSAFSASGKNVFLIQRYDRQGSRRIHQEDFAQVVEFPPHLKYEHLSYETLARLALAMLGQSGYEEFIRRLVFMVAAGNVDAHLKNWSLLYPDGINPTFTPLYDQVAAIAWPQSAFVLEWALKFAGTKNLYTLDEAAFLRLAQLAGGDQKLTQRIVQDTLSDIAAAWGRSAAPATMPAAHTQLLKEYWQKAPLLKPFASAITS